MSERDLTEKKKQPKGESDEESDYCENKRYFHVLWEGDGIA